MVNPQPLNGSRLRRPWWTTPVKMTLWLIFLGYFIVWIQIFMRIGFYAFSISIFDLVRVTGPVPVLVALFFGICGLGWGYRSAATARSAVAARFGAHFLDDDHAITRRVHALARRLSLPMPAVGVMDTANAFAVGTGPKNATVVLGMPLINNLSDDQLDAVIAHELAHIATADMQRMQFAEGYQAMFSSLISSMSAALVRIVARSRLSALFGHMLGRLARMTFFLVTELMVKRISRSREYHADALGAVMVSPHAMIGALKTLHGITEKAEKLEDRFACLMFRGQRMGYAFATHPTLEQRCQALEKGTHVETLCRLLGTSEPPKAQRLPRWRQYGKLSVHHLKRTVAQIARNLQYLRLPAAPSLRFPNLGSPLLFTLSVPLAIAVGFFLTLQFL